MSGRVALTRRSSSLARASLTVMVMSDTSRGANEGVECKG